MKSAHPAALPSVAASSGRSLLADAVVLAGTGAVIALYAWRSLRGQPSELFNPGLLAPFTLLAVALGIACLQWAHRQAVAMRPGKQRPAKSLAATSRAAPRAAPAGTHRHGASARSDRVRFSGRS